jgi:hypothetical protein
MAEAKVSCERPESERKSSLTERIAGKEHYYEAGSVQFPEAAHGPHQKRD